MRTQQKQHTATLKDPWDIEQNHWITGAKDIYQLKMEHSSSRQEMLRQEFTLLKKKWYAVKLIDRNSDTCSEQVYYVWHTFDIPMCTQRLAPLHFPVEAKAANGPGIKSGNQVFLWLTSLTEMLQDLNWKSQSRRMKILLCFTWFCTQGSAPADGLLCRETEKTHKNEDVSPYHEWASGRPIQ